MYKIFNTAARAPVVDSAALAPPPSLKCVTRVRLHICPSRCMFHNARCVDCTFMWRWRLGCARMCVCVCPSTWRGICVCVCWQAGSEKRSGGACVAAALAQHRSLATAGSAHLKHVQAVFPGPPTRPPSLREGVNRPVCMKLRFEYLLKKKGGGDTCVFVCAFLSVCVC